VFLRNSGHTLSRDQLMDQIRNREWVPNDRSIDVLVGPPAAQAARRPGRTRADHHHPRRRLPVHRQRGRVTRRLFGLLVLLLAAQAAEKVRYCDYPVYPPVSWSDGKQPAAWRRRWCASCSAAGLPVDRGAGQLEALPARRRRRPGRRGAGLRTAQRDQACVFPVPVLREEVAVFAIASSR
jgi:hypothetical protein